MDLFIKLTLIFIAVFAALGTISFIITNIIKTKHAIEENKPKASPFVADLHAATIQSVKEKYKAMHQEALIIPDDDCVPRNKITTSTLIDMKNGTLYLLDRRSAPSGKDILEVVKPGAKIYDLPGDLFLVSDLEVDMEKLYEGAK